MTVEIENFKVTSQTIDEKSVINCVKRPNAGAIVTFHGTVREITDGKRTLYLEYEAYESMAEKELLKIGHEIARKWPSCRAAITHRIGTLQIEEVAVVIATSSPHRKEAFEAASYAIERIKQIVPIWKKEHWEDGEVWIGNQLGTKRYDNKPTD